MEHIVLSILALAWLTFALWRVGTGNTGASVVYGAIGALLLYAASI